MGIHSIAEMFDQLGGVTEVARKIGVGPSTASEMKRRGSIPVRYWPEVIRLSAAAGYPEIDADALLQLHVLGDTRAAEPLIDASNGHFSRHAVHRRANFRNAGDISAHVSALRSEWGGRR